MAVFRVERTSDYTVMSNYTLNIELLNQCVKKILMQPDGNIQFQVCNGTII